MSRFLRTSIGGGSGETGPQGETGIQGYTGLQGITGAQGQTGLQGVTGPQGDIGNQGVTGAQGQTGSQGIQGETGLQGVQGDTGTQGATGLQGVTGVQGIQGDTGIQGQTGIQGVTGPLVPASLIANDSNVAGAYVKDALDTIHFLNNKNSLDNAIGWYDQGIVFSDGTNAYYPSLVYDNKSFETTNGPKFKCWFSIGSSLRLITSYDCSNWSSYIPLTGFTTNAHHPHVVYDRAGFGTQSNICYKMWYWNSSVSNLLISTMRYAESSDGINWVNDQPLTQDNSHKIITGNSGDWNAGTWGFQKVYYQGNALNSGSNPWDYSYVAYYDANTGTTYQTTGIAYSVDGKNWFNDRTSPVIDRTSGDIGAWDYYSASFGSYMRDINGHHAWYSGGIASGNTDNFGIGYAKSVDGIVWVKDSLNPIFSVLDGVTYRDERCYTPSVVDDGSGTLYMLYTAQGTAQTGRRKLALATLKYSSNNSSGSQGATGLQGITGLQGSTGTQGIQGTTGLQGVQGETGFVGATGVQGETGLIGTTGIQGDTGLIGATGLQGFQGETGIQGITGLSALGVKATEIPLGQGYTGGIFSWQDSTMTSLAIDDLNRILLSISPVPPGDLFGDLTLTNSTKYSAILPTGLSTAWYQDSRVAGDTISDYIIDGTYNLSTPNPSTNFKVGSTFGGDEGTVYHLEDNVAGSSRNISSGVGITGNIEITAIDTYNTIWRKGNARINFSQTTEGYKIHAIRYTSSVGNQTTNNFKVWFDDQDPTPSFSTSATITQNTLSSNRYLSGIRYYYTSDTFNLACAISDIANKCIRPTNPISYSMPGITSANISINGSSFAYNASYNMGLTGIAINASNIYNINATLTVTARKPSGKTSSSTSPSENRLINTYSSTYSTNGNIYMLDEKYRWLLSTDFSVIPVGYSDPTGNWDSSAALTNGNLLLFNSTWNYPNINFSTGYLPAQSGSTNYSTFSGDQVAVWAANIGLSHSSMSVVFTGIVYTDISAVGSGNLNFEIRLPNETSWLDAGRAFGDGNGCRLGSSSGSTLNLTFGTYTSSNSNGVVFIRVTLRNTSATKASRMVISGT